MNIEDYYLDMDKVFALDNDKSTIIIDFYRQIVDHFTHGNGSKATETFFNTLLKAGYLKNKIQEERGEKIDLING